MRIATKTPDRSSLPIKADSDGPSWLTVFHCLFYAADVGHSLFKQELGFNFGALRNRSRVYHPDTSSSTSTSTQYAGGWHLDHVCLQSGADKVLLQQKMSSPGLQQGSGSGIPCPALVRYGDTLVVRRVEHAASCGCTCENQETGYHE